MNKALARFLFENSPWSPFWSALAAGYCAVGADGQIYLTEDGAEYLDCHADKFANGVPA
jgi:hypothetical protein